MQMMSMDLPTPIKNALEQLETDGFEAFCVGGCVRDALMGVPPKDFDITTNATPEEVKLVFHKEVVIETGILHGTVTVLMDEYPVEVTTYRIDGEYMDNRRPDNVLFTRSLTEDLARRDFTINAMAFSEKHGIIDPFEGKKDLDEKIIRCVGDPFKRFGEDALRILRAVRFASVLGFNIEPLTHSALFEKKETIKNVAIERITAEFTKLICGKNVENILLLYAPIIELIVPEIKESFDFLQNNPYHSYDVYTHTVKVVSNAPDKITLRLASFFHDIGKPRSYTQDNRGIGHFYGHQKISAEIAKDVMTRLKFDNETKEKIFLLVFYHDIQIKADRKSVKRVLSRFSEEFFLDLIALKKADVSGQHPDLIGRVDDLSVLTEIFEDIKKSSECFILKDLAINGNDLIEIGYKPGKQLGNILKDCLQLVISEKLENDKHMLIEYIISKYNLSNKLPSKI